MEKSDAISRSENWKIFNLLSYPYKMVNSICSVANTALSQLLQKASPFWVYYWYERLVTHIPKGPSLFYLIQNGKKLEDCQELLVQMRYFQENFGDMFSIGALRPTYFLTHPDHISAVMQDSKHFPKYPYQTKDLEKQQLFLGKGIIITASDDEWKAQREILTHPFQPGTIYNQAKEIISKCLNQLKRVAAEAPDGIVNVSEEGFVFSGSVIFSLLSPDFIFDRSDVLSVKTIFDDAVKSYHEKDYAERVKPCRRALDHLAKRLLESQLDKLDEEGDSFIAILLKGLKNEKEKEEISREEIIRILSPRIINLFTSGFETTATTLGWALYVLAQNPVAQMKIREEFEDAGLEITEELPSIEELNKLKYLNAVIKEVQRLYPILFSFVRYSVKEGKTRIGEYDILPDSQIQMLSFLSNRHPDKWERPEEFYPERFLENDKKLPNMHEFGSGPRRCLGEYLAKQEIRLFVLSILQDYELEFVNHVEQVAGIVMHPSEDIQILFKKN